MAAIPEEQAGLCWDTVLDFNRERKIRILYLRAFTIIQMKGIVIECCKNEQQNPETSWMGNFIFEWVFG